MMIINLLKDEISLEELLRYYNANITNVTLPKGVNGLVWSYKNVNNIYINNSLSYYKQKKTILHELAHIELNHLNQMNKDLFAFKMDNYEDEADNYLNFLLEQLKND